MRIFACEACVKHTHGVIKTYYLLFCALDFGLRGRASPEICTSRLASKSARKEED